MAVLNHFLVSCFGFKFVTLDISSKKYLFKKSADPNWHFGMFVAQQYCRGS